MEESAPNGIAARVQRLGLYVRTARHLHWRQVVYRPIRIAQKFAGNRERPREATVVRATGESHIPALRNVVMKWRAQNVPAAIDAARETCAGRFTFLHRTLTLPEVDWRRRYESHLWTYNLHYFDYAVDLGWAFHATGDATFVRRFERLAGEWTAQTADRRGDGWDPYAISVRLANWTYAVLLMWDELAPDARDSILRSLDDQRSHLSRHLEWHILANHLQKNLHGLVVSSALLDGVRVGESEALRQLWAQLKEQILEDGGHYERSPMYHAIALRDCLELLGILGAIGVAIPEDVQRRVRAMANALVALSRRDGTLHLFNDAAHGIAHNAADLRAMVRSTLHMELRPTNGVWSLPDTGYFGWRDADHGDDLIIDCGELGPAYQPGHAHCDVLSYELDLKNRPVVVDAGVHGYNDDPYREYARSTRAHNTIMIDGREQAELWATFRVARRPRVEGGKWEGTGPTEAGRPSFTFMGAYRPFHSRGVVHNRSISRLPGELIVVDRIDGAHGSSVESFVHLHPDFEATIEDGHVVASAGDLTIRVEPFGINSISLHRGESNPVQGWHCPEFGVATPQTAIVMRCKNNSGAELGYRIKSLS